MTSSKTFRKFLLASAVSAVLVFGAGPSYSEEQTAQKVMNLRDAVAVGPVSYTHLTLPTIYSVEISGVAVTLKKQQH